MAKEKILTGGRLMRTYMRVLLIFILGLFNKAFAENVPADNNLTAAVHDSFPHHLFSNTFFSSNHINDTVPFNFVKRDPNNITRYFIAGTFFIAGKTLAFTLTDSLVINYKRWAISPGNLIAYTRAGIKVTDFQLISDSSQIAITNQQGALGNAVVNIRNLNIGDVTSIFNKQLPALSGLLDADFIVSTTSKMLPGFSGTASVRELASLQQPVGNVMLSARMLTENTIQANLSLTGDNEANLQGTFCLSNDRDQLDAVLDVKKLQLITLGGLADRFLQFAYGSISGAIALKGRAKHPEWKGTLNLDTTKFVINKYGTTYYADKQQLSFDYPAIAFSNFMVKDSLGHTGIINGNICLQSPNEHSIDIKLNTAALALVNAPKAINNKIYGYAGADAQLYITGNLQEPALKGDLQLDEATNITLVLPEKNTDNDVARSVVRFIDRDTFDLPEHIAFKPSSDTSINIARFLTHQLTIRSGKQATLTIVIDPSTGDELKAKGTGQWDTGLDSNRNMVMKGSYQLDSGYYQLNYEFLKKRFNILPGSAIYFNGSPTDALADIKAVYIANTSVKDLLGNEVGTVDPKMARSFKQNIPFRVILSLKGSLRNPAISFNIELPEEEVITRQLRMTIENKLVQFRSDIAGTNKQVFALLAMDRFVGEQSTDFFKGNDNGSDFADIARESVSRFLSSALDQIASDLFKGINIDLNLKSYKDFVRTDETQKTDLNVEVSKNFLNDRLTVTVGKNFGIESQDGSTKASQQKASRFLPDVTVNYKLSADGKYLIRAYNKNPFEVVMDGYIVETGLAFVITMDYEKYEELFLKDKKAVH